MELNNPNNLQLPSHCDPGKVQRVIDRWAHGKCPLNAQDFIDCTHRMGVMIDLMLAQGIQESALGTVGRRPLETKNIFDVGNVDDGSNHTFGQWHDGLYAYAHLMATSYGCTAEEVCGNNFLNKHNGGHYASDPNYPQEIWNLVLTIRGMLQ